MNEGDNYAIFVHEFAVETRIFVKKCSKSFERKHQRGMNETFSSNIDERKSALVELPTKFFNR